MGLAEWRRAHKARLNNFEFKHFIAELLDWVRAADPKDRPARAGAFGGTLRSFRSGARIELTRMLMRELEIEPTQHTAKWVMLHAFNVAVGGTNLNRHHAMRGRDASRKYMDRAYEILPDPRTGREPSADVRGKLRAYEAAYAWYCDELHAVVEKVKAINNA